MAMDKNVLRFVAGEKLHNAIARIKKLNKKKISGMIDHLGENLKSKNQIKKVLAEYKQTTDEIYQNKLDASVDIKLTNLGLCISKAYCLKNVKEIVTYAHKYNIPVWFDAEQHKYRKATVEIYLNALKIHPKIYITVQSNFKDSDIILQDIIQKRGHIRLVKGVYKENKKLVFTKEKDIKEQFVNLMEQLFITADDFAIATHDTAILKEAQFLEKKYYKNMQFQFLLGINKQLATKFSKKYFVAEYVPYGTKWKHYYKRRIEYLKTKKRHSKR